jgi:hypothetical protein
LLLVLVLDEPLAWWQVIGDQDQDQEIIRFCVGFLGSIPTNSSTSPTSPIHPHSRRSVTARVWPFCAIVRGRRGGV